jgi:predicted DNA-binding transcriptional regulator AlpA
MIRFMRMDAVAAALGCSVQEVYRRIRRGCVPPPIKRGRVSLWIEHELARVTAAEASGANDAELHELVRQLVAERGGARGGEERVAQPRTRGGRFARQTEEQEFTRLATRGHE